MKSQSHSTRFRVSIGAKINDIGWSWMVIMHPVQNSCVFQNVYPTQHEKLKEDRSVLSATMM